MLRIKFWLVVAALAACAGYSFWYACKAWAKNRVIADTPTSRVRSAAQGYVELCGRGLPAEHVTKAPLTGTPCTWWRYKIEQRGGSGRGRSWCTIDGDTSSAPFLLDDDTGQCLVDPCGAEVFPSVTSRWYGPSAWPTDGRVPDGSGVFGWLVDQLFSGAYRYTEYRLQPREPLYAIGAFRSLGGIDGGGTDAAIADLLHKWKQDKPALLARFDTDHDGSLSASEWERARAAACREVDARRADEERGPMHNVLADPMDGRAFLLAACDGGSLARRFRRKALAGFGGFISSAAALTWMLEHV
jgi:hypothetical protein